MIVDSPPPKSAATVAASHADETAPAKWMSLVSYRQGDYRPGASLWRRLIWYAVSGVIFESRWFPHSGLKRRVLRLFGATVGRNVVIKPGVRIKFPWRLSIGDDSWIGEDAWIDNLSAVTIGNDVCISQGAYLCTGSHDSRRVTFDLLVEPIVIANEVWIAARSTLLPGVELPPGVLVAAGSVVTKSTEVSPGAILAGVPAREIGQRNLNTADAAYQMPSTN